MNSKASGAGPRGTKGVVARRSGATLLRMPVIVLLLAVIGCAEVDDGGTITWEQAERARRADAAVLIDVRIPSEVDAPIAGAIAVPYMHPTKGGDDDAFTMEVEMASSGRSVILVCLYGIRSRWARDALLRRGVDSVSIHRGTRQRAVPPGVLSDR